MESIEVRRERREDGITIVTIDRPKALNALDRATLLRLGVLLDEAAEDPSLRALVLTGGGEKAFVAGGDISAMATMTTQEAHAFARLGQGVLGKLEALSVPTIAAVNGFALGGGLELALACDLVYASEKAKLGQPEVNLGVIPGFGGTQRLPRRIGPMKALELCVTGDLLDAATAKQWGLVLEVFPPAELLARVLELAGRIASRGPVAVAAAKRALRAGLQADQATGCALELEAFAVLFGTQDQKEGMQAFLQKRPARFTGA